ncbi:unnamed protein product [Meloidogyne enterolobii]|uniref:Uncharacterized protein n=1 Tax=Meloidogyne enterolobii TaxID=390850 RepID=A0ACB0XZR2_MELEN
MLLEQMFLFLVGNLVRNYLILIVRVCGVVVAFLVSVGEEQGSSPVVAYYFSRLFFWRSKIFLVFYIFSKLVFLFFTCFLNLDNFNNSFKSFLFLLFH